MKAQAAWLSIVAGVAACALGRWLGFSWPIAVLVGIAVWLIIAGLMARR